MCETMANIPVEEKSSYVLTEDMIDAAMNQQFAFQEDLESEGELSSLEESVEADQDSQESCASANLGIIETIESDSLTTNPNVNTEKNFNVNNKAAVNVCPSDSPTSTNNKMSVLVIETGLDKNGSNYVASAKQISKSIEQPNANGSLNEATDANSQNVDSDLASAVDHENNNTKENKENLTILKSILSDTQDKDGIIDLCDSEVDDFPEEDDLNEAESIDDELRSVMETNLMAEIGLTVNKKTATEPNLEKPNAEKAPENVMPRISVKNIAQISSQAFNRLPQSNCVNNVPYSPHLLMNTKINENQGLRTLNFALKNTNVNSNVPVNENNQGSNSIRINKIAVPHSTFVNSQGHKMKCVYVKSTSTLPFVINTPTQTTACSANVKYVLTHPHPMKEVPSQMPAITALKNLTKNLQPGSQKSMPPKNAKVLTVSQKLQRPSLLQNATPHKIKKDNNSLDALKTSLLYSTRVPYTPPNTFPENPIFTCVDCNDKFLLKSSLANHIERRSISIRYWCQMCKSDLQFYNKCALSIHLRGHNNSLKHIDNTSITINPIPKEMLEKGITTSFLKDNDPNTGQPAKSTYLSLGDKSINSNNVVNSNTTVDSRWKAMSVVSSNLSSQKITTVAGQSKSVCYQTPSSSEYSKPVISAIANSQASKKLLPMLLPKSTNSVQAVTLVSTQSLPTNSVKEPANGKCTNKTQPKSVILFCNKLPQSANVPQNSVVNPISPNAISNPISQNITANPLPQKINDNPIPQNITANPKTQNVLANSISQNVIANPIPQNVANSTPQNDVNPILRNVVGEANSKLNGSPSATDHNDSEMVIDDDATAVPNNTEEEEIVDVENIDGNMPSTSTPTVLKPGKSSSGKVKKGPTNSSLVPKSRNCSECRSYCPNISRHLNGSGRPLRIDLACKICNLILPSKCSLKIHHRIHMKIPPYKCPDCGKDFTSWDELHAHLKFSCGHFAKCVRYICNGCKAHFPTKNGLAVHIVKNHGKDIFKCSLCPVAFYKKTSLIKHIFNDHPNENNKSQIGMDYKQCEMCPKKLLPEESFLVHAQEHTSSMIYGYKCSMCSIVYANKMAFIIHQIKEKTKKDQLLKSEDHSKTSHGEERLEGAAQASDSNSDFEDEPVIVRKYPDSNNDLSTNEKDPLSLDGWECSQEQKVKEKTEELCIVCKKNSVVLLPGIDLNRQSLCCKQCVKPLDGDNASEPSRNGKGSRNSNKLRRIQPKNIYRSSSTDEVKSINKKRRISDISHSSPENTSDPLSDSPSRKKSRKKPKEKLDPKGQTHIQGQVIKSRSLDELCHKCSKCKFVTEKRESFLEHITVHRSDPNTYQCLECGLCFVVLPSLERHLQMHHGIKDVNSYTENNKASLPQKVVPIEEETHDNQCRVCYEIFDCKSSLDKHFRIHGMAFMSRLSKSP